MAGNVGLDSPAKAPSQPAAAHAHLTPAQLNLTPTMTTIPSRDEQHGGLGPVGAIAQSLKATMREGANWPYLTPGEQEALDMVAHAIGRILSKPSPPPSEHWSLVADYAHAAMRLWEQGGAGGAPAKPDFRSGLKASDIEPPRVDPRIRTFQQFKDQP
jgi:hypothetical protein